MRKGLPGLIAFVNTCVLISTLTASVSLPTFVSASPRRAAPTDRPNVIVLMTDDQETTSMPYMPHTRKLLASKGVTFENAFVSFPLCCPSRATFLTGQYAHNHGVFFNDPPYGYESFRGKETLPVLMRDAGYRTIHIGKYLNLYGSTNPTEVPKGWSEWHAPIGGTAHWYHGYTMNHNGTLRQYGKPQDSDPDTYVTDVERDIAIEQIKRAQTEDQPFFMSLGFLAPHGEAAYPDQDGKNDPRGAPRHVGEFEGLRAPRTPSFDEEDVSDKPPGLQTYPRFTSGAVDWTDAVYRARLRSLQAVDEAIASIMKTLEETKQLRNTYIVFTSDNGFLLGQHRFRHHKYVAYEESIRVPFLVRGPGLPRGETSLQSTSNVDLAPTILDMAGLEVPAAMDGRSMLPYIREPGRQFERMLLFESGPAPTQGYNLKPLHEVFRFEQATVRLYQGIRTERYKYIEYEGKFIELFDLVKDPFELDNAAKDPAYSAVKRMLSSALGLMRDCAGETCRVAEAQTIGKALA